MKKIGIVLINLGGPDSLDAVRPFLYNLFSDRDIIPLGPPFMQKPLARLISLLRSPKTVKAYTRIGGGSPILSITRQQAEALQESLREQGNMNTYVGMRYWHPFIEEAVQQAHNDGMDMVIGLSLYPQYSEATTGSSRTAFNESVKRCHLESRFVASWYDYPLYIEALAHLIMKKLKPGTKESAHILFSAHSLPTKFIEAGDPYVREIEGTVKAVVERMRRDLALPPHHIAYQSRSGPVQWLKPSTDDMIETLAREGVERIITVPVSFVSDHIETLYEIDILYRDLAQKKGIVLERVESLNTHPLFIAALKDLVLLEL